ncbi:MAG: NAD-dependent epimerase/dehydratase family protein [Hyphomicrobium sp.]
MTKRVLVTGAGGLIGHRVVELLSRSCEPVALVRSAGAAPHGVEEIATDLADPTFVQRLPSRMDAVIHLAQAAGFANFPDDAPSVFRVNTGAFAELLAWAAKAGVKSFVHASSGGLYGRGPKPFSEEAAPRIEGPLAFYLGTKCAAELLAKPYGSVFSVAALRYFFVYGPRQRDSMLIPRLVRSVSNGQAITLAGRDGMRINPIYVDDAAEATIAALRLEGSTVANVAGSEALPLREIAHLIGEAVGVSPQFQTSNEPEGNDLLADISRMQELLHTPRIGFREGVGRLVDANRVASNA